MYSFSEQSHSAWCVCGCAVVLQLFLNTDFWENGQYKMTAVSFTADALWELPRADRMAL